MIEILKSVRLSKGSKIALSVWFILLMLVVIIFLALRFMSKDRIDYADMIVDSEITRTKGECKATCSEATPINFQKNGFFEICKKQCMDTNTLHTYRINLVFKNEVFKAQRFYGDIHIAYIEWSKDIEKLGNVASIYQAAKDNGNLEIVAPYQLQVGQNIGIASYSTEFSTLLLQDYAGRLIFLFGLCVMMWFLYVPLRLYLARFNTTYPKQHIEQYALNSALSLRDKLFLALSACIIIALFIFQFWLGFPGYHLISDNYISVNLNTRNLAPVLPSYVLGILYFLFGKHLYYMFLFNLVPFYTGLLFLVWGFYIRFRSLFAIFLIFPVFIGNIYFQNFLQLTSFSLPMLLFCGYAMVLFMLLVPLSARKTKIMWWLIGIVFFCAILWRHNAIFSVFPVSFVLVYMWLCNRGINTKEFVKKYINGVIACAILCLCVVIIVPRNLIFPRPALPANHVFLHQIAGACVPADDSSCFKDEWYYPHKTWSDVKELYKERLLDADPFNVGWGYHDKRPFPSKQFDGLYTQWLKAIFKHPIYFAQHELRFLKAMWFKKEVYMFDSKVLQEKTTNPQFIYFASKFRESERSIVFTPTQEKIYDFLYEHRLLLNHFWGVALSFGVMILSLILWLVKRDLRNSLLMFSFGVGFAGFFSALFIVLFTPLDDSRYMSPVLPLGLLAIIGFIAFMLDCYKRVKV
ncbi:hypothetical protein XJ32_00975 [Helicobacter bilis]|uniref:Uncharacterized protein n=1 Tax=Helicobacter bilis TaxID=37372 RepID=A0A1Q2LEP0_9HELI|nr:hypothetical protein [Helicobacter bilis]AQQ58904.1 hypothetical protein XJ32_00975 [Helicobacter bilis]